MSNQTPRSSSLSDSEEDSPNSILSPISPFIDPDLETPKPPKTKPLGKHLTENRNVINQDEFSTPTSYPEKGRRVLSEGEAPLQSESEETHQLTPRSPGSTSSTSWMLTRGGLFDSPIYDLKSVTQNSNLIADLRAVRSKLATLEHENGLLSMQLMSKPNREGWEKGPSDIDALSSSEDYHFFQKKVSELESTLSSKQSEAYELSRQLLSATEKLDQKEKDYETVIQDLKSMKDKMDQDRVSNTDLRAEQERLQKLLVSSNNTIGSLRQSESSLRNQCKDLEEKMTALVDSNTNEPEIKEYEERLQILSDQLESKERIIENLNENVQSLQNTSSDSSELLEKNRKLEKILRSSIASLKESKEESTSMQKKIDELEGHSSNLQSKLKTLEDETDDFNSIKCHIQANLEESNAELSDKTENLINLEKQLHELEAQITDSNDNLRSVTSERDQHALKNEDLQRKIADLQNLVTSSSKSLEDSQSTTTQKEQECLTLKMLLEEKERLISESRNELVSTNQYVVQLKDQVASYEDNIQSLTSNLDERCDDINKLTGELKILSTSRDKELAEREHAQKTVGDVQELCKAFQERLKESTLNLRNMEKQLEESQASKGHEAAALVKELNEIKPTLNEKDTYINQLNEQIVFLEKDFAALQVKKEEQRQNHDYLNLSFIDLQKKFTGLEQENHDMENQIKTLKDSLSKLEKTENSLKRLEEHNRNLSDQLEYYKDQAVEKENIRVALDDLRKSKDYLENELNSCQKMFDESQTEVSHLRSVNESLQTKHSTFNSSFEKVSSGLQTALETRDESYEECLRLKECLSSLTSTYKELSDDYLMLKETYEKSEVFNKNMRLTSSELSEESKHLKSSLQIVLSSLSETKQEMGSLMEARNNLQNELTTLRNSHEDVINQLNSDREKYSKTDGLYESLNQSALETEKSLRAEKDDVTEKARILEEEKEVLIKEKADLNQRISLLTDEIQEKVKKSTDLDTLYNSQEKELKILKNELSEKSQKLDQTIEIVEHLKEKKSASDLDFERFVSLNESTKEELNALKMNFATLEQSLKDQNAEKEGLSRKLIDSQDNISVLEKDKEILLVEKLELQNSKDDIEQVLESIQGSYDSLSEEHRSLVDEYESLKDAFSKLKELNQKLIEKISHAEDLTKQQEENSITLDNRLLFVTNQLREAETVISQKYDDISGLENEKDFLNRQLSSVEENVSSLREVICQCESNNNELLAKMDTLGKENDELNGLRKTFFEAYSSLFNSIKALSFEDISLKGDEALHLKDSSEIMATTSMYIKSLDDLNNMLQKKELELQGSNQDADKLSKELQTVKSELDALTQHFSNTQEEYTSRENGLITQLSELNLKIDSQLKTVEDHSLELQRKDALIDNLNKTINNFQKEMEVVNEEVITEKANTAKKQSFINELTEKVEHVTKEKQSLLEELSVMKTSLKETSNELSVKKTELKSVQSDLSKKTNKAEEIRSDLATEKNKNNENIVLIERYQADLRNSSDMIDQHLATIKSLEEDLIENKEEFKASLQESTSLVQKLEAEKGKLLKDLELDRTLIAEQNEKIKSLQCSKDKSETGVITLEGELQKLKDINKQHVQKLQDTESQVNALQGLLNRNNEELSVKEQQINELESVQDSLTFVQNELKAKCSTLSSLEDVLTGTQAHNIELEGEVKRSMERIKRRDDRCDHLATKVKKLHQQLSQQHDTFFEAEQKRIVQLTTLKDTVKKQEKHLKKLVQKQDELVPRSTILVYEAYIKDIEKEIIILQERLNSLELSQQVPKGFFNFFSGKTNTFEPEVMEVFKQQLGKLQSIVGPKFADKFKEDLDHCIVDEKNRQAAYFDYAQKVDHLAECLQALQHALDKEVNFKKSLVLWKTACYDGLKKHYPEVQFEKLLNGSHANEQGKRLSLRSVFLCVMSLQRLKSLGEKYSYYGKTIKSIAS